MIHGLVAGREHTRLGGVGVVAQGPASVAISKGGARKTYPHVDPNEDCALFACGRGGSLLAVADGHDGEWGSECAVAYLLESVAPLWTALSPPVGGEEEWKELALDALFDVNDALITRAAERGIAVAHTTLSLVLARPAEDLLVQASMGDSHAFIVSDELAVDLAWASLGQRRSYYLGYGLDRSDRRSVARCHVSCQRLGDARALVLATDGLSEAGIGVLDPAAAAFDAVHRARALDDPELRPLEASKAVVQAALAAHRQQRAGDNVAAAVLWLGG